MLCTLCLYLLSGSKRCVVPELDSISSVGDAARVAVQLRTARRQEAHARSMEAVVMRAASSPCMGAMHAAHAARGRQGAYGSNGAAGGGEGREEEEEEEEDDDVTRFEEADPEEVSVDNAACHFYCAVHVLRMCAVLCL